MGLRLAFSRRVDLSGGASSVWAAGDGDASRPPPLPVLPTSQFK